MKSKVIIVVIIVLILGWWFWPRATASKLVSTDTAQEIPREAPLPTAALPTIDQNTDLPAELNKLTLPDPSPAYLRLDESVNKL